MRRNHRTGAGKIQNSDIIASPSSTTPRHLHNARTMNTAGSRPGEATPLFLLKTKSIPSDGYEEQFRASKDDVKFEPSFVPVLEHKFKEKGMKVVRSLLRNDRFGPHEDAKYGGLIFTSQRAVEAFSRALAEAIELDDGAPDAIDDASETDISNFAFADDGTLPHIQEIPVYTVGPATTRALRAIQRLPSLQTFGSETGNGEALAHYILDHYVDWHRDSDERPPLLFLVGEQRRDVIPKTLMNPRLGMDRRIQVDEVVVYGTGVMESFDQDFAAQLRKTENRSSRWVVVFSPTGCEAMLRALDMLDSETGKVRADVCRSERSTYIATIGPTTRDHLRSTFGFDPDVCAANPTPESLQAGIRKFIKEHRQ
jgi:uroporphyrinogen-III synthase